MKPVLGSHLKGKRAVSTTGVDLGEVIDASFSEGGILEFLIVRPEVERPEVEEFLDMNGFLNIPFSEVKAIGRYVIVGIPK